MLNPCYVLPKVYPRVRYKNDKKTLSFSTSYCSHEKVLKHFGWHCRSRFPSKVFWKMKLFGVCYNNSFPIDLGLSTILTWLLFTVLFTKFEEKGSLALLMFLWFVFFSWFKEWFSKQWYWSKRIRGNYYYAWIKNISYWTEIKPTK